MTINTRFSKTLTRLALPALAALLALGYAPDAKAYQYVQGGRCGVVHWRATANMVRDWCTIGPAYDAYHNAKQRWWDTGRHLLNGNWQSCSLSFGNGKNETGIALRAQIGGLSGKTYLSWNSSCEIQEADILLADDMTFPFPDESYWGYDPYTDGAVERGHAQGWAALVHEWGHAVGLDHQNQAFAMMRYAPPLPLSGDTPQPAPDDAAGVRALYGGSEQTNLYASSQYRQVIGANDYIVATPNFVSSTPAGPVVTNNCMTVTMLRGRYLDVRYTVMNNGSVSVNNTGFRIFLNDSPFNYGGGYNLFNGTANVARNSGFTETRSLFVPTSVPAGFYWILWEIDSGHTIAESNENDNSVHSCMTVDLR